MEVIRDKFGRFVKNHKFISGGEKGWFVKNQTSLRKGIILNKEQREKISNILKECWKNGKYNNLERNKKLSEKLKLQYKNGIRKFNPLFTHKNKHSIFTKKLMSINRKGKVSKLKGINFENRYGIEKAKEIKNKLRIMTSGKLYALNQLKNKRKTLVFPLKDTSIEVKIQNYLKQLNIEFFTHQYIKEIEHGYQCDILIPSIKLVIECDGDYWHNYPIGKELDHIRTKELLEKGFKVLRLWERDIKIMNLNKFKSQIDKYG